MEESVAHAFGQANNTNTLGDCDVGVVGQYAGVQQLQQEPVHPGSTTGSPHDYPTFTHGPAPHLAAAEMPTDIVMTDAPTAAAALLQTSTPIMQAAAAADTGVNATLTSSHDSAGTGVLQLGQQQQQLRTPSSKQGAAARKDTQDQVPCFVQTSALFTNMCGYCGTRSTSGCWRRGWEIGPNRFINLCNKCGLRHKAGKLPSVPEPPPPQLRGRAAAAAAAAAAGTAATTTTTSAGHLSGFPPGDGSLDNGLPAGHSNSAAELLHLLSGQASPNNPSGGQGAAATAAAAASDPTGAKQGGRASSGGRRRRAQKPLTPKWSRVGPPASVEFGQQEDPHMLAQLLAAGAFAQSAGGDGTNHQHHMYGAGMTGMVAGHDQQPHQQEHQQQQHQQQLAALLQSLVDGSTPSGTQAPYGQASAGQHQMAADHNYSNAGHNNNNQQYSNGDLGLLSSPYTTALHPVSAPAATGPATQAATASAVAPMDSAQAVAAVLAAAAASAAAASTDSVSHLHAGSSPLKLSKLSVNSGYSALALADGTHLSSPAAKKRRTKQQDAAAEEGAPGAVAAGSGGGGGPAAAAAARPAGGPQKKAAQDAAAAGDAADALLALRSSAKPESPSWARLQPGALANNSTLGPRSAAATTMGLDLSMNMNMPATSIGRQVTSPSMDTAGVSNPSSLAHYLQPLQTHHHPAAHPQMHLSYTTPPTHFGNNSNHLQPSSNTALVNPAYSWSPAQLQAWLQQNGFGDAVAAFDAHGIDGPALSGLMRVAVDAGAARLEERLKADIGVDQVALRLRLVDKMMAELTGSHKPR